MNTAAPTARREALRWRWFESAELLAQSLSADVAQDLRDAIAARGQALAALAGGRTPARFLRALAQRELPWEQVTLTTTDERCVAADDAQSNQRLLREQLLTGAAAHAAVVSLYDSDTGGISSAVESLPLPFDVVVLGMGLDGHIASLFPEGDTLVAALAPQQQARALPLRAPAAQWPRITLTLATLLAARRIVLHIEQADKRAVLQRVLDGETDAASLPVAHLLARSPRPVDVYWSP